MLLALEPGLQDGVLDASWSARQASFSSSLRPPSWASCFKAATGSRAPRPALPAGRRTRRGSSVALGAGAVGQHRGLQRDLVEREVAQDQPHLAGVDVALLQPRQRLLVEGGAVRAGERGVLDDRDRRRRRSPIARSPTSAACAARLRRSEAEQARTTRRQGRNGSSASSSNLSARVAVRSAAIGCRPARQGRQGATGVTGACAARLRPRARRAARSGRRRPPATPAASSASSSGARARSRGGAGKAVAGSGTWRSFGRRTARKPK